MEAKNEELFDQEQETKVEETKEVINQELEEQKPIESIEEISMETLPQIKSQSGSVNVFGQKESFDHSIRVATMFSKSDLVPKEFKGNIANCLIAFEMATRLEASPLMVMQNLYIVHGKPAWSSQFLIATLNKSGKFSPLRYEEDLQKNGGSIRAVATDLESGEVCKGVWVSMEMADSEGWSKKTGSKWKTMPELMLRYRAAAFFTRQFAPEVSMGIMTQEEVIDITPLQAKTTKETRWTNPND